MPDAKDVTIGMAHMHLSNAPLFVSGLRQSFEMLASADGAYSVHVVDHDRQPHALTTAADSAVATAASLAIQTKEDLQAAGGDGTKRWRGATGWTPVPCFGPSELRKPLEA